MYWVITGSDANTRAILALCKSRKVSWTPLSFRYLSPNNLSSQPYYLVGISHDKESPRHFATIKSHCSLLRSLQFLDRSWILFYEFRIAVGYVEEVRKDSVGKCPMRIRFSRQLELVFEPSEGCVRLWLGDAQPLCHPLQSLSLSIRRRIGQNSISKSQAQEIPIAPYPNVAKYPLCIYDLRSIKNLVNCVLLKSASRHCIRDDLGNLFLFV